MDDEEAATESCSVSCPIIGKHGGRSSTSHSIKCGLNDPRNVVYGGISVLYGQTPASVQMSHFRSMAAMIGVPVLDLARQIQTMTTEEKLNFLCKFYTVSHPELAHFFSSLSGGPDHVNCECQCCCSDLTTNQWFDDRDTRTVNVTAFPSEESHVRLKINNVKSHSTLRKRKAAQKAQNLHLAGGSNSMLSDTNTETEGCTKSVSCEDIGSTPCAFHVEEVTTSACCSRPSSVNHGKFHVGKEQKSNCMLSGSCHAEGATSSVSITLGGGQEQPIQLCHDHAGPIQCPSEGDFKQLTDDSDSCLLSHADSEQCQVEDSCKHLTAPKKNLLSFQDLLIGFDDKDYNFPLADLMFQDSAPLSSKGKHYNCSKSSDSESDSKSVPCSVSNDSVAVSDTHRNLRDTATGSGKSETVSGNDRSNLSLPVSNSLDRNLVLDNLLFGE